MIVIINNLSVERNIICLKELDMKNVKVDNSFNDRRGLIDELIAFLKQKIQDFYMKRDSIKWLKMMEEEVERDNKNKATGKKLKVLNRILNNTR